MLNRLALMFLLFAAGCYDAALQDAACCPTEGWMPQNVTDVDTFTDPVTAPADGDNLNAASIVTTAVQGLANRTRHHHNVLRASTDLSGDSRTVVLLGSDFNLSDVAATNRWSTQTAGGSVVSTVDQARAYLNLRAHLPNGATLTRVRAQVAPGVASGSRTTPLNVSLLRVTPDLGGSPAAPTTASIFSQADDGTTSIQWVASPVLTETVSSVVGLELEVLAGVDPGAHVSDTLYAIELTFDDPGPRNF